MLVVDSNVVISSLLKGGVPYKAFLLNFMLERHELIAPEFLWIEVERHKDELMAETAFTGGEYKFLFDLLREEIYIIPSAQFIGLLPKARELLPDHTKDAPFIALALKFNSPIFSGDKRLKQQSEVRIMSPREVLDELLK